MGSREDDAYWNAKYDVDDEDRCPLCGNGPLDEDEELCEECDG